MRDTIPRRVTPLFAMITMIYSRRMQSCWLATILIVLGSGCVVFKRDLGPIHKIPRRYRATEPSVTEISLKCRDRRPEWERHYHSPVIDPKLERWSAELLTVDNFSPNPVTQFKRHLSAKLTQLEPAPISAEIIVQRFHVVVKYAVPNRPETDSKTIEFKVDDDCDTTTDDLFAESEYHDAKAKWAESDRKARAEHRKSPPEPRLRDFASGDTHEDPFDDVERQITTLLFKAVLIDLPVAIVTSAYDATKQYAYRGSPPEWASVPPGVTCEIEAQIELKWADGRQTTISLKTRQTEPYAIAPDGRKDEVAPFQAEVILQSVDNVAHQAAEFLRSEVAHESNGKEDL